MNSEPRPNLDLPLPGRRSLAWGTEGFLAQEADGQLAFIDRVQNHVYSLEAPTYAAGHDLLMRRWPSRTLGVYRDTVKFPVGFWIGRGATLVCELSPGTVPPDAWMPSTRIVASPDGLHLRHVLGESWDWLFLRNLATNKQNT